MSIGDPFKILGLNQDCSEEEIKKRYFELAQQHHPDKNKDPHALNRFKMIAAAYEQIKNEELRAEFILNRGKDEFARGKSDQSNNGRRKGNL